MEKLPRTCLLLSLQKTAENQRFVFKIQKAATETGVKNDETGIKNPPDLRDPFTEELHPESKVLAPGKKGLQRGERVAFEDAKTARTDFVKKVFGKYYQREDPRVPPGELALHAMRYVQLERLQEIGANRPETAKYKGVIRKLLAGAKKEAAQAYKKAGGDVSHFESDFETQIRSYTAVRNGRPEYERDILLMLCDREIDVTNAEKDFARIDPSFKSHMTLETQDRVIRMMSAFKMVIPEETQESKDPQRPPTATVQFKKEYIAKYRIEADQREKSIVINYNYFLNKKAELDIHQPPPENSDSGRALMASVIHGVKKPTEEPETFENKEQVIAARGWVMRYNLLSYVINDPRTKSVARELLPLRERVKKQIIADYLKASVPDEKTDALFERELARLQKIKISDSDLNLFLRNEMRLCEARSTVAKSHIMDITKTDNIPTDEERNQDPDLNLHDAHYRDYVARYKNFNAIRKALLGIKGQDKYDESAGG